MAGGLDDRLPDRDTGAHHQPGGRSEDLGLEAPQEDWQIGHLQVNLLQTRWFFTTVGDRELHPEPVQITGAGEPGLAETDDQRLSGLQFSVIHQRIFRLARPISTSTTVMIQKRTMTRGSGQPLSSKW